MRLLLSGLVLGGCVLACQARLEAWHSDRALWTAAVRTAPARPRPPLNLAAVALREGQWDEARQWLVRSLRLAAADPPARQAFLAHHAAPIVDWLAVVDGDVCAVPEVRPFCAWDSP